MISSEKFVEFSILEGQEIYCFIVDFLDIHCFVMHAISIALFLWFGF